MTVVRFSCTANAQIREYWKCEVPQTLLDGDPKKLQDYLWEKLYDGDIDTAGQDEIIGGEIGRKIEIDSIQIQ